MNKIKCKVCGTEFLPKKEHRYTANADNAMFAFGAKEYDCFDCIKCGCQIIAGTRYARLFPQYLNIKSDDFKLSSAVISGGREE